MAGQSYGWNVAEHWESMRSDYDAAREGRFRRRRSGVGAIGHSADWHYRNDGAFMRVMELARDFDRNNMIVGQGVTRLIENCLQDGIKPDPATGNPEIDTHLKEKWKRWAGDPELCDAAGEQDFHGLERLTLRQTIVDGDHHGIMPLIAPQLQLMEAHRCRTPHRTKRNIVHGVRLSPTRRREEYFYCVEDVDPMRNVLLRDTNPVLTRDSDGNRQVLHVYDPRRTSQTRGVTTLAPVADVAGMHDDIQFAKLVQAQATSMIALIEERDKEVAPPSGGRSLGRRDTIDFGDGTTGTTSKIGAAMHVRLPPGVKMEGFSANVPNPEFFKHAMMMLSIIAVNLHLPVAVLLLDPSNTNFSGWRGAMDQARVGFRAIQQWMVARFHRPIYRWKVRQWINEDPELRRAHATLGEAIFAHDWRPPEWSYIEPVKDASADLIQTRNALNSHRRVHARRGRDWDELAPEIVADNALIIRRAKQVAREINAEFADDGHPVSWRELCSLPVAEGLRLSLDSPSGGDASQTEESPDDD